MTTYDDKVAASMGYYWHEDGWDEQALTSAGLPVVLLPQVFGSLEGIVQIIAVLIDNGVRFAKAEI